MLQKVRERASSPRPGERGASPARPQGKPASPPGSPTGKAVQPPSPPASPPTKGQPESAAHGPAAPTESSTGLQQRPSSPRRGRVAGRLALDALVSRARAKSPRGLASRGRSPDRVAGPRSPGSQSKQRSGQRSYAHDDAPLDISVRQAGGAESARMRLRSISPSGSVGSRGQAGDIERFTVRASPVPGAADQVENSYRPTSPSDPFTVANESARQDRARRLSGQSAGSGSGLGASHSRHAWRAQDRIGDRLAGGPSSPLGASIDRQR